MEKNTQKTSVYFCIYIYISLNSMKLHVLFYVDLDV